MQSNPRRTRLSTAFLALTAALLAIGPSSRAVAQAPIPPHLRDAMQLCKAVSSETSNYQHKAGPVAFPGDPGVNGVTCRTDCSGFMNALLKHAYDFSDEQLSAMFHARRPLAKHYFTAIEAQHGFQTIDSLKQARPGDILAVRYLNSGEGENTGHVMLMAGQPRLREPTQPVVSGTLQWEVPVIDESSSGHGVIDSRHLSGGGFSDGLGNGILRVYTDPAGRIVGHSWSVGRKSKFRSQAERPLLIGRLQLP